MNVIDNYINSREECTLKIIELIKEMVFNKEPLIQKIRSLDQNEFFDQIVKRISALKFCHLDIGIILGENNYELILILIDKMLSNRIIIKDIEKANGFDQYFVNKERVKFLDKNNVFENLLLGFNYIMKKYTRSVVAIENIDKDDKPSIGTGLITMLAGRLFIVTNSHVLENHKEISIYSVYKERINYEIIHENKELDVAIIKILDKIKCDPFNFYSEVDILSDIITIGFPNIPMAKDCYQVVHKGEINAIIHDFSGNENILFSARTSSGNSGSPLINIYGAVVGMVARELFNKGDLIERGILPYYAAIPSNSILRVIEEAKSKIEK